MTTRFSPFRSRQSPARRRSCKPHRLRIETLEGRQMLAADILLAGDVLDQELDAPSDDMSATCMSAMTKSMHDTAKAVMQTSSDGTDAGAETLKSKHDTGGPGYSPNWIGCNASIDGAAAGSVGDADTRPMEEVSFSTGSINYLPMEEVTFSGDADTDAGVETRSDAAFADHEPRLTVALDTTLALEAPLDTRVVDQAFELDADAAAADLDTSSPAGSLEGSEGDQGDTSSETQPLIDSGMDDSTDGLLETEPGAETTGPDDTGIQFGLSELIWDVIIWFANRKG